MQTLIETKTQSWLVWFFRGILILGFLFLFARLIDLQIIRGSYFRSLAEGNRVRKLPILAPRGRILARGGEVLVDNKQVKRRVIFNPGSGFEKLDAEEENSEETITEWTRDYLLRSGLAHVSGYIGMITPEEVGKVNGECPEKGPRKLESWVGRTGLEEKYDCLLSGQNGEELVEVDALGRKIRTLGRKNPTQGRDLRTTINYGLQKKVASVMNNKTGTLIVTDINGEVLALYSSPSFDPNLFVGKPDEDAVSSLLEDKSLPLFNRAIGGLFHPGSVFKPIVAITALEDGEVDENFLFEDTGQITIKSPYGIFAYKNWYFTQYGGVEGKIGITKAIARSTDTFFYKLGELVGAERLSEWSGVFGLDEETGIDLPGEAIGLVPSPSWKLNIKGERWFLGNTYHMSIGQGDIALTPIAVSTAISSIANDGILCRPHLTSGEDLSEEQSRNVDDRLGKDFNEDRCKSLEIKKENIDLVKEGMRKACSAGGTGYTFFDFKEKTGIDVACKTGTAETEKGNPHAWFVAFGPLEKPEIVVTVLLEHGGEGSSAAGPIAREIFNYWFKVQPTEVSKPADD